MLRTGGQPLSGKNLFGLQTHNTIATDHDDSSGNALAFASAHKAQGKAEAVANDSLLPMLDKLMTAAASPSASENISIVSVRQSLEGDGWEKSTSAVYNKRLYPNTDTFVHKAHPNTEIVLSKGNDVLQVFHIEYNNNDPENFFSINWSTRLGLEIHITPDQSDLEALYDRVHGRDEQRAPDAGSAVFSRQPRDAKHMFRVQTLDGVSLTQLHELKGTVSTALDPAKATQLKLRPLMTKRVTRDTAGEVAHTRFIEH